MGVAVIRQTACYSNVSANTNLGPHLVITPNEWLAGCHAWLTFSAMLPTKLAMSGLSDLVTPLGYSPNLKVQFWKSLPSNVRKESKRAYVQWTYDTILAILPHSENNLYLTSTSPYILSNGPFVLYNVKVDNLLVWMSIQWKEFQTATKGLILESSMTRQQNVLSELVVPIFLTW